MVKNIFRRVAAMVKNCFWRFAPEDNITIVLASLGVRMIILFALRRTWHRELIIIEQYVAAYLGRKLRSQAKKLGR